MPMLPPGRQPCPSEDSQTAPDNLIAPIRFRQAKSYRPDRIEPR